jgi:hypothetical protein
LPVFLKTLLIQRCQNLVGRTSFPVKSASIPYQKLEHFSNVCFATYDQVDLSISNIYGKTIPAEEWSVYYFVFRHAVYVFSQHPKSTGKATINDILDVADIETRTASEVPEVCISVLLFTRVLQFLLLDLIDSLIFYFSLLL